MDAIDRAVSVVVECAKFRPDFLPERMVERFVHDLVREMDLAEDIDKATQGRILRRLATEAGDAAERLGS